MGAYVRNVFTYCHIGTWKWTHVFSYVAPLSLIWFLAKKYLREVHRIKSLEQLLISNEENW